MTELLIEKFEDLFGRKPEVHVRCPGRVNLIGEHIDYHGYSVLPMAIESSTTVLAARNDSGVLQIANEDERYPKTEVSLPSEWKGAAPPKWFDYVLCGWKGVVEDQAFEQTPFSMLLSGEIPESSGLSSSSSVVCASALASLAIHSKHAFEILTREQLADLCAKSEYYVGTQGGGMDQAAEVLAQEGSALKINFNPLSSEKVDLPQNAVFLVAHCGQTLNKAATSQFNERVVEGRIVGKMILKHYGVDSDSLRLKDVQLKSGKTLEELLALVETFPEHATREEIVALIGDENLQKCLSPNTKQLTQFAIRARGRHVFSEARRVEQFADACKSNNIELMGKLMSESHWSCSKDYQCSCPELDELVNKYVQAGAVGARLTGAGWGGCAVALFNAATPIDTDKLHPLFVSKPAAGIQLNYL